MARPAPCPVYQYFKHWFSNWQNLRRWLPRQLRHSWDHPASYIHWDIVNQPILKAALGWVYGWTEWKCSGLHWNRHKKKTTSEQGFIAAASMQRHQRWWMVVMMTLRLSSTFITFRLSYSISTSSVWCLQHNTHIPSPPRHSGPVTALLTVKQLVVLFRQLNLARSRKLRNTELTEGTTEKF